MKNLNTLLLASSLVAASLLATSTASANDIKTAGQASSLCKEQAAKAHPGYKRSKSVKIKQSRGVFKLKLKVVTDNETITTFCEVTKKGEVSYAKA